MSDGFYVSMAGAAARSEQLDSIADNLANAQTPGFKPARPAFEAFMAQSGSRDQVFAAAVATGVDVRPGPVTRTDNKLDVLPEGDGMLGVRTQGGQVAFTRAGRVSVDADGRLMAAGLPLLDVAGNPIDIPKETTPTIESNGMVKADGREVAQIGVWRFDGPMGRIGPQLLTPGENVQSQPVDDARLRIGEVELGSYSALEATVQLVGAQRHFEAAMQAIQTYRRLDDKANEIGHIK